MAKQADVLMLLGRAFHKVADATTNELSLAFMCDRTTVSKLLFAEHSALAGLYGHTTFDRYFGAVVLTTVDQLSY